MRGYGKRLSFLQIYGPNALELLGSATVWDDMLGPPGSAGAGSSNPTYAVWKKNVGGTSAGVFAWSFGAPGGGENDLCYDFQWTHRIKTGSDAHIHVHWSPTTADVANVSWQAETLEANLNEAFPANTTLHTAATFTTGGTASMHLVSEIADVAKADRTISGIMKVRVARVTTNDTYVQPVIFHGCDVHIELDTLGSRQEYIK